MSWCDSSLNLLTQEMGSSVTAPVNCCQFLLSEHGFGGKGWRRENKENVGQQKGPRTMTCIDDNANGHLRVSDGAASKQKTLAAEASPGLVRMLPGDEEGETGVVSTCPLVSIAEENW